MITQKFMLSPTGRNYISAPRRNKRGRISTTYFKDLILIHVLVNGFYEPANFKDFVESLNVLQQADQKQMPTRHYVEWKHYSDRAKQQLFDKGLLAGIENGRVMIPLHNFGAARSAVSCYDEEVTG